MIDALGNRWSHYIPASEYESHQEQMKNAYVGIGVTIVTREDGYIDIQKVEPGGPAHAAGIQPGDILIGVEGHDVAELTVAEVKSKVRGKIGTQVKLQLRRGEQTLEVNAERKEIQTVVATGTMLEGNVGLVKIVNFDSRCESETLAAVKALLDQGANALIFDVRYNPGGYKDEMVGILDYLLPKVAVFRSVDYTGKEEVDYSDEKCLDIPMAVLVNQDSYSAAELFAAALQEYEVAVVVGEHTTGKGHYQNTYRLPDGSAAVLSVGRYTTPKGVNLDGVGIAPDVEVLVEEELYWQIYAGNVPPEKDPQIQAALAALLE
jgi:carboxyl-terminal processing protease